MATALTRDGSAWKPAFLESIDQEACIGCGRCFKVCGRSVLQPVERAAEDEDDDEEMGGTVMSVASPGSCVGCGACGRVCAKRAHAYVEA